MKKKLIKNLCLAACVTFAFGLAACEMPFGPTEKTEQPIKIVADWAGEKTETVAYGSTYNLNYLVTSTDGGMYAATAIVKDSTGKEVPILNGKFVVSDKNGYTITYTFVGEETYVKTVKLTVKALNEPILTVEGGIADELVKLGDVFVVSPCVATDYYDGALEEVVEIYQVKNGEDVQITYDQTLGEFTPTERGEYYVKYSATNSENIQAEKRSYFYVWESSLTGGDPTKTEAIVKINETNYKTIFNTDVEAADGPSTFVSAETLATLNLGGANYTGNATRFKATKSMTNAGYRIKNEYTVPELAELAEDYNRVTMYIAGTGLISGSLNLNDTVVNFANIGGARGFTNNYEWQKLTITFSQYADLLKTYDYQYCPLLATAAWSSLDRGENDMYFYFGDIEFWYQEPSVALVDEATYTLFENKDVGTPKYVSAAELALLNIEGEYTGNATKFIAAGGAATNAGYKVKNNYTAEELTILAQSYNTVTMWLSATGVTSNSLNINTNINCFATKAGAVSFGVTPKWQKLTLSMEEYIELVATTDYKYCPLLATAHWSNGTYENLSIYFGDIAFSYVEEVFDPYIEKIDSNSATSANAIIWNPNVLPSYVSKADWQAAGLTGDYTGDAVKMNLQNQNGFRIVNEYTTEELTEIAKTYNSVSLWFAVHCTTDGFVGYYDIEDPTTGVRTSFISACVGNGVNAGTLGNKSVWKKYTLPIETYISLLREQTGGKDWQNKAYTSYCPLVRVWCDGTAGAIYVGDVFFENVTQE